MVYNFSQVRRFCHMTVSDMRPQKARSFFAMALTPRATASSSPSAHLIGQSADRHKQTMLRRQSRAGRPATMPASIVPPATKGS